MLILRIYYVLILEYSIIGQPIIGLIWYISDTREININKWCKSDYSISNIN